MSRASSVGAPRKARGSSARRRDVRPRRPSEVRTSPLEEHSALRTLSLDHQVHFGIKLHLVRFFPFAKGTNAMSGTTRTLRGEIHAIAALVAGLSFFFSAR